MDAARACRRGFEVAGAFPHEVSEGQLQRACLARALITQPRYVICDELTSMLDVSTQAALLEVIANDVQDRITGILLITHDHLLGEHWCDRIVELPALVADESSCLTQPRTEPTFTKEDHNGRSDQC